MVGKHIMLNKLTTRFKEEDKKMIAEAIRVAPPGLRGPGFALLDTHTFAVKIQQQAGGISFQENFVHTHGQNRTLTDVP
jgi:hypothetical protein